MISQPMNGLTEEEIHNNRKQAEIWLKLRGYSVVDTYIPTEVSKTIDNKNLSLKLLAMAVEKMSECSLVYFVKGWEKTRGCVIEHLCAEKYGLDIHEE